MRPRMGWVYLGCLLCALWVGGYRADAQIYNTVLPERLFKPNGHRDRGIVFCNLAYQSVRSERDGNGWNTDFPAAGRYLMIRLWELTTVNVEMDAKDEPVQWVVNVDNPVTDAMSTCPFLFTSDVGTLSWQSDGAVERVRNYLLKGGFLWVDDFWGQAAWDYWEAELRRVLPPRDYPIIDVPADHPLFTTPYAVSLRQIPNVSFWRSTRETSERGESSAEPHMRAVLDDHGRVMVLMTHNTDIADVWQHDADQEFFSFFAIDAYRLAVNVWIYAMSH